MYSYDSLQHMEEALKGTRISCELSLASIIGHAVIWFLLTLVTLGVGLFFYPYFMFRYVVNHCYLTDPDGKKTAKLSCEVDAASVIGHVVIWAIISVLTLGLGYFVFAYKVFSYCLSKTKAVDL